MPMFRYTAVDPSGKLARGSMEATSADHAIQQLRRDGMLPIRSEPESGRGFLSGLTDFRLFAAALSRRDLAEITRELSIMLGAGQDLDRALRFLVETAPRPRVATALEAVRAAVRDGDPLATAMARQPRSFPRLYVGVVRAGEAGGMLTPTLDRLAIMLERERALVSSVRSAMIYPGVLLLAMVGSVTFLLTEVLPQFVPLFAQNGAHLPASTQFMIDAGAAIADYGLYALVALAVAFLLIRALLQRDAPRLAADRFVLRLPVVGGLTREVLAARFSRTLGTLLSNGVPLLSALGITRDVLGNRAAALAVDQAAASARRGAGLSRPLQTARVFPLRTVYLLRLGEETALLGPMALRAAEIHEEQTRLAILRLVSLLVPAITVVMGAVVAGIVSSLVLAMLSLNNLAGG
jgi:general secretion pathway protein F